MRAARGARAGGVGLARVSRRRNRTSPVVSLATFGVDQRVISLIDLSEFRLGRWVGVDVRVVSARQPAVSGFDLIGSGRAVDAQQSIQIAHLRFAPSFA